MKKFVFTVLFAFLAVTALFAYQYFKFHDHKLHIVFCDVGQGDGILITTPSSKQILVDSGPDKSILSCLSRHMPFWDRSIDVSLLTHPHSDHFTGYYFILDQYKISQFATEELKNKSDGFSQLEKSIQSHHLPIHYVATGDTWKIPTYAEASAGGADEVVIQIVGPTREYIFRKNPDGFITNSAESGSLATLVSYGKFSALLTGDAPIDEMHEVVNAGNLAGLNVLQIPHHGSNTGIDDQVLSLIQPHLAVISVGKNNYGHPTLRTLGLLKESGIKFLRTDQMGDVELVSDGKEYQIYK